MEAVAHHVLLALAVAALMAAGLRAAALASPSGLERIVSGAVLAAAAAAAQAILLGLVGLGTRPIALGIAAALTWLATRILLPAPGRSLGSLLAASWKGLAQPSRIALGAVAGASLAWIAWRLRYPALGHDMVLYHLSEAIAWVQGGSPGSTEPAVVPGLPVASYPVTDEVLLSWALGISRGLVPASLWSWATFSLTAAAGWLGLRSLSVPRLPAALAVAAVCSSPVVLAWQSNGAITDPSALAWLVACAALCAASARRPALLAPAIVAGGLAAGTKTTTLPLAALALALGLLAGRRHLRGLANPLVLALGGALLVGGVWYLRNLVDHGSPLWPFVATPWGDPLPETIERLDFTFLDRPGDTISRLGDDYLDRYGGELLLLLGGVLVPLLARRREVVVAGMATAGSLLLWARAPVTGVAPSPNPGDFATLSTIRYLLPAAACAAAACALATRRPGLPRAAGVALLAGGLALNLANLFAFDFPVSPSPATPLVGAALGAALAVVAEPLARLARRRPVDRVPRAASGATPRHGARGLRGTIARRTRPAHALAAAIVLAGALMALPASGYLDRSEGTGAFASGVVGWVLSQPGFDSDERPVGTAPTFLGLLAGERLEHPVEQVPLDEPCAGIRARATAGLLVVFRSHSRTPALERCLRGELPDYQDSDFTAYAPP